MPPSHSSWATPLCQFGLIARGVVFAVVGVLFLVAAVRVDPSQAGGLREALQTLQNATGGGLLFALIAAGLAAFGAYSLLEAAYRRVPTERV